MSEESKTEFIIPPGFRAYCHLCGNGGKAFASLEELQEHFHDDHVMKSRAGFFQGRTA